MMGVDGETGRRKASFQSIRFLQFYHSHPESSNSKGPRDSRCCYDGWFENIGYLSLILPRSVGSVAHSVEDGSAHTPHNHKQIRAIL